MLTFKLIITKYSISGILPLSHSIILFRVFYLPLITCHLYFTPDFKIEDDFGLILALNNGMKHNKSSLLFTLQI